MGDLAKLYSPVTSTMDVLESRGVTPEMWNEVRRNELRAASVAAAFKGELILAPKLRPVETIAIRIPALPRLTAKGILRRYNLLKSVECDNSPEDEVVFNFATVLRENENSTPGQEYQTRLASVEGKLGISQAIWLVQHQDEFPELMAILGKVYVDFPATIAVDVDGNRGVPYLDQDGGRWCVGWGWCGSGFDTRGRIAGSGKPA